MKKLGRFISKMWEEQPELTFPSSPRVAADGISWPPGWPAWSRIPARDPCRPSASWPQRSYWAWPLQEPLRPCRPRWWCCSGVEASSFPTQGSWSTRRGNFPTCPLRFWEIEFARFNNISFHFNVWMFMHKLNNFLQTVLKWMTTKVNRRT